jgi:hypothetical protein
VETVERGDWKETGGSKAAGSGKSSASVSLYSSSNQGCYGPGVVGHTCNPSYLGGIGRWSLGKSSRLYLKNKLKTKELGRGSSGRAPEGGSEFRPQYCKKKKNKKPKLNRAAVTRARGVGKAHCEHRATCSCEVVTVV